MTSATPSLLDERPELVFALVGGASTQLDDISRELKKALLAFDYQTVDIRLSDLLPHFTGFVKKTYTGEDDRIMHLQKMGNDFRSQLKKGEALALAGIDEIRTKRNAITKSADTPARALAYILHQLKHPAEVDLLREVYGASFLLIAGHAPRERRIKDLARRIARKAGEPHHWRNFEPAASKIVETDEKEEAEFGQNVRDTYPKADFFVNLMSPEIEVQRDVQRFVSLLFGHPFHTPYPDEYAMYHANAVSLRSSDDNRQVGAIIFNIDDPLNLNNLRKADVIAVGTNEVPRGGGGLYWEQHASPDPRDQALLRGGEDRANEIKVSTLAELIEKIKSQKWLKGTITTESSTEFARELLPNLKGTQFRDIGEFSRPVHAEMAALIDAARRGVAVDNHSMYVTTFPCHNCAKHIIAAGIQRVVYLDPYPKSRAGDLYAEEIVLDPVPGKEEKGKVNFIPYSGIAPRQYQQLFSMSERGAKKGKPLNKWEAKQHSLFPLYVPKHASRLYIPAEREALDNLPPGIYIKSGS